MLDPLRFYSALCQSDLIYFPRSELSFELHITISKCPLTAYTWMSTRHLRPDVSKSKLVIFTTPHPHLTWSFSFAYFSEWYHQPSYYIARNEGVILDTSNSLPIFYPSLNFVQFTSYIPFISSHCPTVRYHDPLPGILY